MSILTQDLWLVLSLFNADIEDSEGFVVAALFVVDDGQSGSLGGYEDSSLAPSDWHRLAQRILVLRGRGQTLSVNHLQSNQTTEVYKMCVSCLPVSPCCTGVIENTWGQSAAGNTRHKIRLSKTTRNTFGLKSSLSLVPAVIHFLSGETRSVLTLKLSHTTMLDFLVKVESASVHTDPWLVPTWRRTQWKAVLLY